MNMLQTGQPVSARILDAASGNVLDRLDGWIARQPEKRLFAFMNRHGEFTREYSYGDFSTRINSIAAHLVSREELEPGSRLLLAYQPGLEMIAALFACARAGHIGVPSAPVTAHGFATALARLDHVVEDCAAAAVLLDECTANTIAENADAEDASLFLGLPRILTTAIDNDAGEVSFPEPNPIFFLQYTSGSTSQPKGVMVSHENLLENCDLVVDHESPVTVSWLPQHHDMGLIGYYIYTALTGGTTYGCSPAAFMQRPLLWLETITRYKATASSAPNFAFELCLHEKRVPNEALEKLDLSSLKFLMAAAEPINADTFRRFQQRFAPCGLGARTMSVAYGLAEFTLAVTHYGRSFLTLNKRHLAAGSVRTVESVSEISDQLKLMSCGHALGDTEIAIVDPESRERLPAGRVGEIWLAGHSKCMGYWNRPELSREVFNARIVGSSLGDGYLRTGDMGFVHEGELYVCGRLKDMIIIRGQNYYPQDIERLVEDRFPALRKGCVASFEIETANGPGVAIVAEITPRAQAPDPADIVRVVSENMKLRIDRIDFVAPRSVEKTSSGKIRRFKTRDLLLEGSLKVIEGGEFIAGDGLDADGNVNELQLLKKRYNLTGEEEHTLLDAGIDSLDTITFLHWLKEIVSDKGAAALAEKIDVKMLGAVTISQIFQMAELLESGHDSAIMELRTLLLEQYQRHLAEEKEMMLADRVLPFDPPAVAPAETFGEARHVLLTGVTGFLGPFLLENILARTSARVTALVRGRDDAHALERLEHAVRATGRGDSLLALMKNRVDVVSGDLEQESLGLSGETWKALSDSIDTIYHNGALVNYLLDYRRMRAANVTGTVEILKLAFAGRRKQFNHVSTTFIFGWATDEFLYESNNNDGLQKLDFGYSQSKWVSEQLVLDAGRKGLSTRIFRPALITPSLDGGGENMDITIRLLTFMIKHGLGVKAKNQVSFMPADVTAGNIVAIANNLDTLNGVFHVVRDNYENMTDITDLISQKTGRQFKHFDLKDFVPEVIRRCTREDILFPLLDFLIGSVDNISSMEFKLYESSNYRAARDASEHGFPDRPLEEIVDGILVFMKRNGILD